MERSWILNETDFTFFREMIELRAGIKISETKKDLMQSRLRSRIIDLDLKSFTDYRVCLAGLPPRHPEWQNFINTLTTNKTDFFREARHFDFMVKEFLPAWLDTANQTLRVWSCASSTGEEPYTISMTLNESLPKSREFRILATDVDTEVLEKASKGVYPSSLAHQIPEEFRSKVLSLGTGDISEWMRVKPHIKEKVIFKRHNLLEDQLPSVKFDLIFCRNVLIYFSPSTISKIIEKLYLAANPNSYLFIGHSESLHNIDHPWRYVAPAIYQK